MEKVLHSYGKFIGTHPFIIIGIVVLATVAAFWAQSLVSLKPFEQRDILPKTLESVSSLNFLSDEFGFSGASVVVVLESEPLYNGSQEVRDMRDPQAVQYMDLLTQKLEKLDNVVFVSSASQELRQLNGGALPKSLNIISDLQSRDPALSRFISSDFSTSVIQVGLEDSSAHDKQAVLDSIVDAVTETPPPPGMKVGFTGSPFINSDLDTTIGPTIESTSSFSFMGIMLVVVLLFASIRHGLPPLSGIFFGSVWVIGLVGAIGLGLSSSTSGAISMIMGIGIDFGIQVAARFRQELRSHDKVNSMAITMEHVLVPMSITTLSVLIGFRAMSLGELKILSELGDIMSLGVLCTMFAAITVVPAILILVTRKGGKPK